MSTRMKANRRSEATTMPAVYDPLDLKLVMLALACPGLIVRRMIDRVSALSIRDEPLRAILAAFYFVQVEGQVPRLEKILPRINDPRYRQLAIELDGRARELKYHAYVRQRLELALAEYEIREWVYSFGAINAAMSVCKEETHPDEYEALRRESLRILDRKPVSLKQGDESPLGPSGKDFLLAIVENTAEFRPKGVVEEAMAAIEATNNGNPS